MRDMKGRKKLYELHAEICKVFSHPKRLEILDILREGELSAGEIADRMGIRDANLSQHLALLKERGIVETRRVGQSIHYRIANPKIFKAYDIMKEALLERLERHEELAALMREGK